MTHGYGDVEPQPMAQSTREVRFEFAENLAEVLSRAGITILISTYQAGKVVGLGASDGKIELSFLNYDRPMGMAVDAHLNRMAVATRDAIWTANNDISVARQMPGNVGTCFLTRQAHVTGDIQAHQMAWGEVGLWLTNTRFSCLCTLDEKHSFVPGWRPPFIDALVPEDRCHLNGLAMRNGHPAYVTVLAESNVAEGWRPEKHHAGCLIDVETGEVVARGFSMPHSPVVAGSDIVLLNSGHGSLVRVSSAGEVAEVARFPGYTRGLALYGNLAVVGLSKIRETATFGGLAISERTDDLKCGIAIVNLTTGRLESQFEFKSGVDEIFDVSVVAHPGRVVMRGPHVQADGQETIWTLPHG